MAGRPKKKVQKQSKYQVKKVEKTKKQIQKPKPKQSTKVKKVTPKQTKAKLAKLPKSLKVRSGRSHIRQQAQTEAAPQMTQQLVTELIARCQERVKQMIFESLQPILKACSTEIITKELSPIKLAVQSINESISKRIDTLQTSITERVQALTLAKIQSKVFSSEESLGDANQSMLVQNSLNTSDSRMEDRFKRIKKSEKPSTNKLNLSYEEQTLNPEFQFPKEKKKRGRKPKSYYATKTQEEAQESGAELADVEMHQNILERSESMDPAINYHQSDSESKASINHEDQTTGNHMSQHGNGETQSVDASIHSDIEYEPQPTIESHLQLEINEPEKLPIKEVSIPVSNDKSNSNLKVSLPDSNNMLRCSQAEGQLLRFKDAVPNSAPFADKEDLGMNAFNRQRVFWKEGSCSGVDFCGRLKNDISAKGPEKESSYKILIIESKYQHDSDYFSFN